MLEIFVVWALTKRIGTISHPVAVAPGSHLSAGERAVAKEGKPASGI